MLTENQKQILRLMIQANPDPDYMAQLGASDDFAAAEISVYTAKQIAAWAVTKQLYDDAMALLQPVN